MAKLPSMLMWYRGVPTGLAFSLQDQREVRRSRHNERIKLVAMALNGLAIAIASTGAVGPIVALFLKHPDSPLSALSIPFETLQFMAVWCGLGFVLHLGAHFILRWLR